MTIFDDLANAVAGMLNTTPDVAGWILGFVTVVVVFVAILALLGILGGIEMDGIALVVPAAFPIAFVVLVGWWPVWVAILLVIVMALAVINPFSSRSAGGGA